MTSTCMASTPTATILQRQEQENKAAFYSAVLEGLQARAKYLQSKYFYDTKGDRLFQEIMACEEYYPFNSELEIFSTRTAALAAAIGKYKGHFDLIELGAGDCTKSGYLIKYLLDHQVDFTYMPIDISSNIISYLEEQLPLEMPGLHITGLNGEYLKMLQEASSLSQSRKLLLFLGSNLGNMLPDQALAFSRKLRTHLRKGDLALIGLDLKKDPRTILAAYNDAAGITRRFNLNLLERINRELNANFDLSKFAHYPTYDPATGSCKSYLVSLTDQSVHIAWVNTIETINFRQGEPIFMEVSQKYTVEQIDEMATQAGFRPTGYFYDSKGWFVDALWEAI